MTPSNPGRTLATWTGHSTPANNPSQQQHPTLTTPDKAVLLRGLRKLQRSLVVSLERIEFSLHCDQDVRARFC